MDALLVSTQDVFLPTKITAAHFTKCCYSVCNSGCIWFFINNIFYACYFAV